MEEAHDVGLGTLYTRSSGRFLQLLGVTLVQALALLPAIFALALAIFVGSFGLSVFLYIPAIILLSLSLYLMVSLSLSQFIASCESLSVWQALKRSWQLATRRRLRLAVQFAAILAVITMASTAIFFVMNLSSMLATSWFVQGAVSAALVVVFLPWLITFGYSIYGEVTE